ncbi:hypothetical protein D3C78_509610 [compost metagenome]
MLGLFQGFATGLEVGAGVRHVAVEPELIKRVREVVVIGNGRRISSFVMGRAHRLIAVGVIQQCLTPLITHADHIADRTLEFKLAFNEGRTQQVKAGTGELRHQLRILDHNRDAGRGAQIEFMAVPEPQAKR